MIDRNCVPEPQFQLWQPVYAVFVDESGSELTDRGVVTGIMYRCPEMSFTAWSYQVEWYQVSSSSWVDLPYVDMVLEHDLSADSAQI